MAVYRDARLQVRKPEEKMRCLSETGKLLWEHIPARSLPGQWGVGQNCVFKISVGLILRMNQEQSKVRFLGILSRILYRDGDISCLISYLIVLVKFFIKSRRLTSSSLCSRLEFRVFGLSVEDFSPRYRVIVLRFRRYKYVQLGRTISRA